MTSSLLDPVKVQVIQTVPSYIISTALLQHDWQLRNEMI